MKCSIVFVLLISLQYDMISSRKCSRDSKTSKLANKEFHIKLSATSSLIKSNSSDIDILTSSRYFSLKKRNSILSILLPWLYFLSNSINMPTFPKYVNYVINNGVSKVSPASQKVYGDCTGLDSLFTALTVNLIGCLSDQFGRKPFIFYSLLGLGLSYLISSQAHGPSMFYLAGCIDGISSCMMSQAQAYATDLSHQKQKKLKRKLLSSGKLTTKTESENDDDENNSHLSEAIGRFQGLAIGTAYIIGIPVSHLLLQFNNKRIPLYTAMTLCVLGCVVTLLFLPESLILHNESITCKVQIPASKTSISHKLKQIKWQQANPFGAINMLLSRGQKLSLGSLAYLFINMAQTGMNVMWINYLDHKFSWSQIQAGGAYMLMGITVTFVPKLLIRIFGKRQSISVALVSHALALFIIGSTSSSHILAFIGIPLLCIGISASPLALGFLSEQVKESEGGALQGAADTVRSISNMIANPMMSRALAHCIKLEKYKSGRALYISSICSLIALLIYSLINMF